MKKLFTLMAAICCAMFVMADDKPQLDSVISNIPFLGGKQKSVYTYDKKGRKTEEILYYWNDKTAKWGNGYKYTIEYNASNDTTLWTRLQWSEEKDTWVNDQMKEYTWKAAGIKTVETTSNWKNNAWVASTKYSWKYNTSNKCTEYLYQTWSTSDNGWINNYRETYSVDGKGNRTSKVEESWYNATWNFTKKTDYTYNSDNQVTIEITYTRSNDDWQGQYKYETIYQNGKKTKYTCMQYDASAKEWNKYYQYLYTYDDNNNLTLEEYFDWDNTGEGSWKKTAENTYTYNGNNDVLTEIRRELDTEKGTFVETQKLENAYDAKTGVLLRTRFYVLSATTKKMELAYSFTYYYQGVEPLGIVKVESGELKVERSHKFIRNGQLLIERDGQIFNLNGARVK